MEKIDILKKGNKLGNGKQYVKMLVENLFVFKGILLVMYPNPRKITWIYASRGIKVYTVQEVMNLVLE